MKREGIWLDVSSGDGVVVAVVVVGEAGFDLDSIDRGSGDCW